MDMATQELIQSTVGLVSSWGLQVVGALAVFTVGRWLAAFTRRSVRRSLERTQLDATLCPSSPA